MLGYILLSSDSYGGTTDVIKVFISGGEDPLIIEQPAAIPTDMVVATNNASVTLKSLTITDLLITNPIIQ